MGIIEKLSSTADTLGHITWTFYKYRRSNRKTLEFELLLLFCVLLQRSLKSRENMMAQNNVKSLPVLVTPLSTQCIQNSLIFAMRNSSSLVTGIKWKIVQQAISLSPKNIHEQK